MKRIFCVFTILLFSILSVSAQTITISPVNSSISEAESSVLTATLDAAISDDVTIPLTMTGDATIETDYTASFASNGEETLMMTINTSNNNYSGFNFLSSGKYIFVSGTELKVFDPSTNTNTQYSLPYSGSYPTLSGNILYTRSSQNIYKADLSDLNNISQTIIETTSDPFSFQGGFSVIGDVLYYQTYQNVTNTYRTYSKEGSNDPVLIDVDQSFNGFFKQADKLYGHDGYSLYEYISGEFTNQMSSSYHLSHENVRVFQDKVYVRNSNTSPHHIYELTMPATGAPGSNLSYEQVEYSLGSDTNQIQQFDFDTNSGDLLLFNQSTTGIMAVYSYQLAPQLKIPAGSTTGTITFTGVDDNSDEANETITITPGTPTNGSLSDSSAVTITLTDNDDAAAVTFAFSAATITEGATTAVTLTATADPVSGQEITIPFTLSGTAGTDEYSIVDDATSIVIPAGSASASVSISTANENDTDVEVMETIVFTIGTIVNGTSETTELALNLESDDNSTVTSIVADPSSIDEAASSTVTATIDLPSSKDLMVPLTMTGDATIETDYTTSFDSKEEQTELYYQEITYDNIEFLSDGRYLLHTYNGNSAGLYNPENQEIVYVSLDRNYEYIKVSGDFILAEHNGNQLYLIEIQGNVISETLYLELQEVQGYFNNEISIEGNNVLYNTLENDGDRNVYYKEGSNDPVQIYTGNSCCWTPLLYNGRFLMLAESGTQIQEIIDQEYTSIGYTTNNSQIYNRNIKVFNEKIYFILYGSNEVWELDLNSVDTTSFGGGNIYILAEEVIASSSYDFEQTDSSNFDFIFNNSGNLIVIHNKEIQNEVSGGWDDMCSVYSYQLQPQLKILAGATTGTVTFTGVDDNSDEANETIIMTPGTATNGSLSDSSAVTITLTDNDDAAAITFAFSAATITEGATTAVTLTATADPVSGQEITIPFTLSGTAGTDEYSIVDDATSIVIPAGSATGSVSISTDGIDDTDVEVMETIVFTIGTIVNGTSETTGLTLNLESDDLPTSALSTTNTDMLEGESTSIILTLEAPTSNDVIIPLILSGTATHDIDYTTDFETKGLEKEIIQSVGGSYNRFDILEDGRFIFLNGSYLETRSADGVTNSFYLQEYYQDFTVSGNTIYFKRSGQIHKITAEELVYNGTNNNVTTTEVASIDSMGLGPNDSFQSGNFSAEGNTLVFQVYDHPGTYAVYKKEGENVPVELYSGNTYAENLLLYNGRVYKYSSNSIQELYNGQYTNSITYSNKYLYKLKRYNAQVYALAEDQNNNNEREVLKLSIESDIINSSGTPGTYTLLTYYTGDDFWYLKSFGFDALGNLILYNQTYSNNNYDYGIYSYSLFPEIFVAAGEDTGTFTFNSVDDNSYEDDETVEIAPGDAINATISSDESLTLNIIDDDNPPLITFELSSETIEENSEYSVELTATANIQSGVEITIPFTLDGTAGTDEYSIVDDVTSIVIPPNSTSGSITISTYNLDDTEVEIAETIIFNFDAGQIVNATTETESIELVLISEDLSTVDTFTITSNEINEGESTQITMALNEAGSSDVYIPLTFTGSADYGVDYNAISSAIGEESLITQTSTYNKFDVLDDGRIIFVDNNNLAVYNPTTETFDYAQMQEPAYWMQVEGGTIYVGYSHAISILDITDISAGQVSLEVVLDLYNLPTGISNINGYEFSVEGDNLVVNAQTATGASIKQTWLVEGIGNAPELIYSGQDCCYKPLLFNGNVYQLEGWQIMQVVDGEYQHVSTFSTGIEKDAYVHNGKVYVETNNGELAVLDIETGQITAVSYQASENISYFSDFAFSPSGDLLTYSYFSDPDGTGLNNYWGIYSYLMSATLKINAGDLNGTLTINSIDDNSYELAETITITPANPLNADIADFSAEDVTIIDNDEQPEVTFALSAENISENSSENVTLTATLSEVSGYETEIAFTLDGTAGADEYSIVDDATSIVVPAGSQDASIEISTNGLDDEEVEMLETIIFTIGDISNAISETSEITLNIESDDDPNIVSITAEPLEFAEHESSIITATIDQASSRRVSVPVSFAGTAVQLVDYQTNSENQGEESFVITVDNCYDWFGVLENGYYVFNNTYDSVLYVLDPEVGESTTFNMTPGSGNKRQISGNSVYIMEDGSSADDFYKINIDDINNISESSVFELPSGYHFENAMAVYEDTVLFQIRSTSNSDDHKLYKKEGDNQAEEIYSGGYNASRLALYDGRIFNLNQGNNNGGAQELIDGEWTEQIIYLANGGELIQGNWQYTQYYNGTLYGWFDSWNNSVNEIFSINLATGQLGTIPYTLQAIPEESINGFGVASNGNVILRTNPPGVSGCWMYSYSFEGLVIIEPGELSGDLEILGIDDDLNAPGEETDETIELSFLTPTNANLNEASQTDDITLTILNNELSFEIDENAFANVPAMSNTSIAFADYDRDGDQDMAVMGLGLVEGIVTRIYRNNEGIFEWDQQGLGLKYWGDLMWVDYNKDGWMDLIVSGLDVNDSSSTSIYENVDGQLFTESTELSLPDLWNTSMDSGDFDNDGDIDFVINGLDSNDQWKKYIYLRDGAVLLPAEDFQNQFTDEGLENGIMAIGDNNFDGDLDIFALGSNNSFIKNNTLLQGDKGSEWWNLTLPTLIDGSMKIFGNNLYVMGETTSGEMKIYFRRLDGVDNDCCDGYYDLGIEGLKNGDIAIGDYNNDGVPDMVITGENDVNVPLSKLYNGTSITEDAPDGVPGITFAENQDIELIGLRESTAKWVDYDLDGDLDLFLSGTSASGEETILYKTNLLNKTNEPAETITQLNFEHLGNGRVKLSWDAPNDDFTTNPGYIVRLATSSGGTELSNTESNLATGQRLVTKSPVIIKDSYETLLNPGNYYWSVQSVDDGLKGSLFSEEQSFQLTYEWKLLNQGGIIDRTIYPFIEPVVKLADIDGDNDMDLIYGSRSNQHEIQIYRLEDNRFEFFDLVANTQSITDLAFIDINDDYVKDLIINSYTDSGTNNFSLHNSLSSGGFNTVFTTQGLYDAKVRLIDINNDGQQEIVQIGRTSAAANSALKIYIYEQEGNSISAEPLDMSDQITGLKSGAFDFGNIDDDEDIDLAITGTSTTGLQSKVYINETVYTETVDPIYTETSIEISSAIESTLDFIDYDADGDLDIAMTGTGFNGPMFTLLKNNGLSGDNLAFEEVENTGLLPIRDANIEFGDINGDGYTDMLYSGILIGSGEITELVEYDPETESYIESAFEFEDDIIRASISFGDIDGDSDLDFTVSGEMAEGGTTGNDFLLKTYVNVRNESADVQNSSDTNTSMQSNILDENPVFIVNERPSIPQNLSATQIGFNQESNTYQIKFSWDASTDDHTPSPGLTYALRVGTNSGGDQIMKPNALPNGYRLASGKGNVEHNLEWVLNLPDGNYFWSVQAIDASYAGSSFADTSTATTVVGAQILIVSPTDQELLPFNTASATISFDVLSFEISDDGSADGYVQWSINGVQQENIYSLDDINIDVENDSAYSIDMWLVNNSGEPIGVSDNITFYVDNDSDLPKLMLQGIIDFTVPEGGSSGKAIHLYASSFIDDLSQYGIGVANNGGGTDGIEYTLPPISAMSGDHILIARSPEAMNNYMNASTYWHTVIDASFESSLSHNGDDAIELFLNGEVIETFGDINVDGTDQPWEYLDTWAYKVDGEGDSHEWLFGEVNCTDGSSTTWDTSCIYPYVEAFSTPENELFDIRIYPNPVDGNYVTIQSSISGLKSIEIIDLNGRSIVRTITENDQINVSTLSSGVYMLKVIIGNRREVFKLIVK